MKIFLNISLLLALILSSCTDSKPGATWKKRPVLSGNKHTVKVGETFTIKLDVNGSTGYNNCWINELKCTSIAEVSKVYEESYWERKGYTGAGGYIYWTFKAVKKGIDTLKINACPTAIMQKECSYFFEDSIHADTIGGNVAAHSSIRKRTIIITVK